MQPTQLEDQLIPWYVWESILISTHPFYYVMLRQIAIHLIAILAVNGKDFLIAFRFPRKAVLTFHAMKRVFVFFTIDGLFVLLRFYETFPDPLLDCFNVRSAELCKKTIRLASNAPALCLLSHV